MCYLNQFASTRKHNQSPTHFSFYFPLNQFNIQNNIFISCIIAVQTHILNTYTDQDKKKRRNRIWKSNNKKQMRKKATAIEIKNNSGLKKKVWLIDITTP